MNNNPDIPDSWAMPDDLAKKVSETLNRKSISPEDELADALEEMARDIALGEPNLWMGERIINLFEMMEIEEKTGCKQYQNGNAYTLCSIGIYRFQGVRSAHLADTSIISET